MLLAVLAVLLALQQTPYTESIDVWRHNVDVIVTDRDGKPVRGLRETDFEILEDGKPRPVTNFSEYAEASPSPAATTETQPPAAPPPRRFVFFIDDMSMHPQTRASLTKQANAFLDETVREGDAGAVVTPREAGERVALRFTADRSALRSAVENAIAANEVRADVAFEHEGRRFEGELRNATGGRREVLMIARRHAARVRRRVELRLATLRAVVATLAPVTGRKVIVLATESLPAMPGREFFDIDAGDLQITEARVDAPALAIGDYTKTDYFDETPLITEIARTAASNGITIYALRPELDVRVDAPGGGRRIQDVQRAMANTDVAVGLLTSITGGTASRGAGEMDKVLRQVAADVDSYYSLAYSASAAGFDKPHKIAVRVRNHPEYSVRARSEVARKSPQREMNDRVVAALFTAAIPNDLGIAVRAAEPKPSKEQRGRRTVDVDIAVPMGRLTFLEAQGKQRAHFTVHYAVTSKDADFVNGSEPELVVEIPNKDFDAAKSKYWIHTIHLVLDKGVHQVAVGVLDGTSQVAGMSGLTLNVD